MGDQLAPVAERNHVEFDIAMVAQQIVPAIDQVGTRAQRGNLFHAGQRMVLHGHAGHKAECAQADARGVEHLGVAGRAAFQHLAARRGQVKRDNPAVQRLEPQARTMRAGLRAARQRLLVDIGQVGHVLADRGQCRAQFIQTGACADAGLQGNGIVAQHPGHAVKADKRGIGRHQPGKAVPGTHHAHRALRGLEQMRGLVRAGRRSAGGGIGMLGACPVLPQQVPGRVHGGQRCRLAIEPQAASGQARDACCNHTPTRQQCPARRTHRISPSLSGRP